MPELPDVEHMLRRLTRRVVSKRIQGVAIIDTDFVGFSEQAARSHIKDAIIIDAQRRGKFLLLFLDSGYALVFHMGMTGELYLAAADDALETRDRLCLGLEGGREIRYRTVRKLGRIKLMKGRDPASISILVQLGVEPLSPACSRGFVRGLFAASRGAVKSLLMAQDKIAGIGNIYADEILFRAGMHPLTRADRVSARQVARIHGAMRRVLQVAARDLDTLQRKRSWLINHRARGDSCPRCQGTIRRILIHGRSSYFCPRCQKR